MPRHARIVAPLVLLSVFASGCADDQELLIVRSAVGFDEECLLDESVALANDTIDVSLVGPFALGLLVSNVQTQNAQSNTNIEDDGELRLKYAEVTLSLEGSGGIGSTFEVTLPNDSIPSGEDRGVVVTVPSSALDSIRGSVGGDELPIMEMSVVLVADRTSQVANGKLGEVRSREYIFPFTVCNGCLGASGCVPSCGLPQLSTCVPPDEAP